MLAPVKRANLRSRLTVHIFDAILHGVLRPGERIVEGKLARQLGVAQTTLREALQALEHQGLLTKQDHRGTFVTKLSTKEIEDIYCLRIELEPLAAAQAAPRLTEEHHAQLEHVLEKMRTAAEQRDFVELLKSDLAFHQLVWKLSGNRFLERALNAVCPPLFACYLLLLFSGDTYDFAKDYDEHRVLLAALRKGGPEDVRRAFREITEIFRVQDIHNLRDFEAARSKPTADRARTLPALG